MKDGCECCEAHFGEYHANWCECKPNVRIGSALEEFVHKQYMEDPDE